MPIGIRADCGSLGLSVAPEVVDDGRERVSEGLYLLGPELVIARRPVEKDDRCPVAVCLGVTPFVSTVGIPSGETTAYLLLIRSDCDDQAEQPDKSENCEGAAGHDCGRLDDVAVPKQYERHRDDTDAERERGVDSR